MVSSCIELYIEKICLDTEDINRCKENNTELSIEYLIYSSKHMSEYLRSFFQNHNPPHIA